MVVGRRWFALLLMVIGLVLMAGATCSAAERMSKEELKDLLGKPDVVVIDVRVAGDYDSSTLKIKGAVRESPNPDEVPNWAKKYNKKSTIVLYCA